MPRGNHWKNLERDSRGRWVKRKKKKIKQKITSVKKNKRKPGKAIKKIKKKTKKDFKSESKVTKITKVTEILNKVKKDFNKVCPRCAGEMKYFKIRCGPERLISVNKCNICNYYIPITDS